VAHDPRCDDEGHSTWLLLTVASGPLVTTVRLLSWGCNGLGDTVSSQSCDGSLRLASTKHAHSL
jgi:hypothetical protein